MADDTTGTDAGGRRVAYFSSGYPRVTDAFIGREIAGVEACGWTVERFAVRPPPPSRIAGDDQRRERDLTTYLLGRRPGAYAAAVLSAVRRSPTRAWRAARLAMATRRAGVDGTLRQGAYLIEAAVLADLMMRRRVAHLHAHFADAGTSVAMLAAELAGIGFSFTVHGPAIFFEPREWALETKTARADFCVAISKFARAQTSIYCDPARWDDLHVVHCGVPDSAPAGPEPEGPGLRALFVGRLEPVKGIGVLLDAVERLVTAGRAVELTVVGDGAMRPQLERAAAQSGLGDVVRFVGYRSQDEIAEHLADSNVLVLPSFAEGVPISLMEAMSAERAVVATEVGGVTELVEHGVNGLTVHPGDPAELAGALALLDDDPSLRRRLALAGRATVRAEFDSALEARRLAALFDDPGRWRGVVRPDPAP